MKKVVIIGGGASGLVAAIYSAKAGNNVTILERNNSVGKKILITGNGRCNYFNENQSLDHYHSSDKHLLGKILTIHNLSEVLGLFDEIGIVPKIKNNYYYPNSNQAVSIKEALLLECQLLGVQIKTDYLVQEIIKQDNKFIINNEITADKVIIATGSKAAPKTGSDGIGYTIAKKLNHTIIKPLPALVQLQSDDSIKDWNGIRCDVNVTLMEKGKKIKEEIGEIQLTDYGVSGICIFNLSGYIARGLDNNQKEELLINFLPDIKDFITYMEERNKKVKGRNISRLFDGLLNYKLADVLIKKSKINKDVYWDQLTQKQKENLSQNITNLKLNITGTNSFDKAQICSGGIPLTEINQTTMEFLKTQGLYFAGEILDVNGDCGGYNLSFAWVTGMLAGKDN